MKFSTKNDVLSHLQDVKRSTPNANINFLLDNFRAYFNNMDIVTEVAKANENYGVHVKKITDSAEQVILPSVDTCLAVIASTNQGNKIISHVGMCDSTLGDFDTVGSMRLAIYGITEQLKEGESITQFKCIGNFAFWDWPEAVRDTMIEDKVKLDFTNNKDKIFDLLVTLGEEIIVNHFEIQNIIDKAELDNEMQKANKAELTTSNTLNTIDDILNKLGKVDSEEISTDNTKSTDTSSQNKKLFTGSLEPRSLSRSTSFVERKANRESLELGSKSSSKSFVEIENNKKSKDDFDLKKQGPSLG